MYASNITAFLKIMLKKGELAVDREDEIIRETLVTSGGEIVHRASGGAAGLGARARQAKEGKDGKLRN